MINVAKASLVVYYPLDYNASDMSGNGNDGTINGDISFVTGKFGDAVSADNDGETILIPDLNLFDEANSFSISFWTKYDASSQTADNWPVIFSLWGDAEWEVQASKTTDGYIRLNMRCVEGEPRIIHSTDSTDWQHVVWIFDTSTDTAYGYVNGVLVGTADLSGYSFYDRTDTTGLFDRYADARAGTYNFVGEIDEVRILDEAINETVVKSLYYCNQLTACLPSVNEVWASPSSVVKGDTVTITGNIFGNGIESNMTVCSTNSFTNGACDGVTLCSNSSTVLNGNLTCSYTTTTEGVNNYYVFATNEFGDSSGVSGSFTVEPGVFDIQITSPENTTYYYTNTTLNYTIKSFYDAVPCWVQNNTGAFEYLGNITNNTLVSIPFNISHGLTEGKKWVNITCMDEAYDYNYTQDKYYTVSSFNFINNTFTSPIPDGSFNSHISNIKYNQDLVSNITATLNYNSTDEPSTYSDSNTNNGVIRTFNSSFYIPEVYDELVNSSIYWNYTFYYLNGSTGYYTTPLQNQTIQMIAIDDCTTYTNKVLNFTGADEAELTSLNFSIGATINISNGNLIKTFTFSFTNDSTYHELCAIPVDAGFSLDSTFDFYDGDGGSYAKRGYYIIDYPLVSGDPSLVDLYLIKKSVASPIKIIVQDASGVNQEGLYVKLQRYYPDDNLFRTVQVGKTDSNGEVNFYVEPSDLGGYAEYYLIIENETTELKRFGPRTFLSTDPETTVKLVESTQFKFTEMKKNINVGVTFNNITNVTSITFSSTSNTAKTYGYSIVLSNITSNQEVCSNSTTSTSVTFTCYLGNVSSNVYFIRPWAIDADGNKFYFTQQVIQPLSGYNAGFQGVLISVILFLIVTGAFLVLENPHISLLGGAISVIIIASFNLIPAKEVLLSLFSIYIIGLYLINIGR